MREIIDVDEVNLRSHRDGRDRRREAAALTVRRLRRCKLGKADIDRHAAASARRRRDTARGAGRKQQRYCASKSTDHRDATMEASRTASTIASLSVLDASSVCASATVAVEEIDERRVLLAVAVAAFHRNDPELAHDRLDVGDLSAREQPVSRIRLKTPRELAHRARRSFCGSSVIVRSRAPRCEASMRRAASAN